MVLEETSRKSQLCRNLLRSASAVLLTGAALLVSPVLLVSQANGQQPQSQQRYAPPVHIQPVAWSVLESEENIAQSGDVTPANSEAAPASYDAGHGREIAQMSEYMRRQNESVKMGQKAQVNAALYQLQASRAMSNQGQPTQVQPSQVRPVQTQYAQVRQMPAQYAAPQRVAQRPAPQPQVQVQRRTKQSVSQPRPSQTRKPVGLQDRISQAFKNRFSRPENSQPVRASYRQEAPVQAPQEPIRTTPEQIELVDHTVDAVDAESSLELDLPVLVEEPMAREMNQPRRAPRVEYRPQRSLSTNDQVIVPSFVEDDADVLPELRLASAQDVVGSGVRRPQVSSHSRPMSYRRTARQEEASVFRNASTVRVPQDDGQEQSDAERLRELEAELDADNPPQTENELPQRSTGRDAPSLLDMDDEDTADEARRARSSLDSEMDDLEDEDPDLEDDEDDGPPVFDERGCEELRSLLLDKSILDISLDISPPASARRYTMGSITRSWTDPSGNVLANGTMVDLRRGYVILDSGQKLPYAKLSEADWSAIAENWLLPSVCSVGQRGSLERNWAPQTVTWHASSLCHKPLYFENIQLERYGHSRGPFLQPVHSTFHFFKSIIFFPYKTAINPMNECQYSLGFYRPGNCAPWLIDPIPFSRDGIRRQTLASLGMGFIP